MFEGDEDQVRAFIADVNLERRDLKKGQKAAILARLFPDVAKLKRRSPETGLQKEMERAGITKQRLSEARGVLAHSLALLDDVIADRTPLDKALTQVKDEQARASSTEAKTERLRAAAPDLADLVTDERMKLDEAIAAARKERAGKGKPKMSRAATLSKLVDLGRKVGSRAATQLPQIMIADLGSQ